ncbi:unnamed protein product [Protopolystoma xenopodis]|uniref:Uncharacterized protein n=1 Tax=Protopolystoma xenopodis TaxID=117903 RepID=A0A3S5FG88_9PLAT|nr:unnamed protein product [Protopolystoma xenopodis]
MSREASAQSVSRVAACQQKNESIISLCNSPFGQMYTFVGCPDDLKSTDRGWACNRVASGLQRQARQVRLAPEAAPLFATSLSHHRGRKCTV